MNVVELLDELLMIANVEVAITLLPEMLSVSDQTPRHPCFSDFRASANVSRSGSLTRRWTFSGITNVSVDTKA